MMGTFRVHVSVNTLWNNRSERTEAAWWQKKKKKSGFFSLGVLNLSENCVSDFSLFISQLFFLSVRGVLMLWSGDVFNLFLKYFDQRLKMLPLGSPFYRWVLKCRWDTLEGVSKVPELVGASKRVELSVVLPTVNTSDWGKECKL